MRLSIILSATLVSLGAVGSACASTTVLNDTFDSPSYSSSFFNDADSFGNPDDVSSAFYNNTILLDGNPGAYGELWHDHDVDRDEFGDPINGDTATSLQSFFSDLTASYTPSLEGEIQSISFSLDVRTSDPIDSLFFEISDSSGGSVANGGGGFLPINSDGEWNTYTLTGVTQSGASGRDFAGSDPLSFGFGFTSFADVFFGNELYVIDVDNFVVTVTPVPEPASLVMLLSVLALTPRRRS